MGVIVQVPMQAVPAQRRAIVLGGQQCVIATRNLGGQQYLSLSVGGVVICSNVLMQTGTAIVRAGYTGFVGDLAVIDLTGANEQVDYTQWGTRWLLLYNPDA